jgi:hypothetical protein
MSPDVASTIMSAIASIDASSDHALLDGER